MGIEKRVGPWLRHRPALLLIAGFLSVGCGSLESVTSGRIGCAPSDITISDQESGWNTSSWVATCHGKTYFCSSASNGRYATDVSCKEAED
ncbi:MAG TPA: hypothetical protein VHU80_08065 [Polyangiaceae bacterium]|jgi:hypothetical protein|nr:hypothetical protein [Polyangiaceae bacterium]